RGISTFRGYSRKPGEFFERQSLATALRVDPGLTREAADRLLAEPQRLLERVHELLAAHVERAADDAEQQRLVGHLDRRALADEEPHQHAVDVRPRPERRRGDAHERLHQRVIAGEQGERPVLGRAGGRREYGSLTL